MKIDAHMDDNDEGIVAWLFDGEVAVDVQGLLGITIGYRITPARARRLAAELIELADHVDPANDGQIVHVVVQGIEDSLVSIHKTEQSAKALIGRERLENQTRIIRWRLQP